jgi:hypothetical protein
MSIIIDAMRAPKDRSDEFCWPGIVPVCCSFRTSSKVEGRLCVPNNSPHFVFLATYDRSVYLLVLCRERRNF